MPEFETVNDRRNRIAQELLAQQIAQEQQFDVKPHSPTSTPGWDASMANFTDMVAPTSTAVAQSLADMNAHDNAIAQAATQANMADFATAGARSSGNLFSGPTDMFGNAFDPGAAISSPTPGIQDLNTAPAPGFGPGNAPGIPGVPGNMADATLGALGDPGGGTPDPGNGDNSGDNSGSEGAGGGSVG